MDLVSVVIPTLNRPSSLKRALRSVLSQSLTADFSIEIIVVDNSQQGEEIANLKAAFGDGVCTLHVPEAGIANARNAGVKAALGRWVAFLDDDEEACPLWLTHLVTTARNTNADAVFGPIDGLPEGGRTACMYSVNYSRKINKKDGADVTSLAAYLGTNNAMFNRARCFPGDSPFDAALNECGGEDSLLLWSLKLDGRRFGWAAEARVVEWVPPSRRNWSYVCRRRFLSGQIRVFVRHMASPQRRDVVAMWMIAGLVQFVVAGSAAIALRFVTGDRSERARAVAFGGLGKMLWMKSYRPALYGSGLIS